MRCVLLIVVSVVLLGPAASGRAATIEYVAHACFVIESDAGERVLVDPFASKVWLGYDFPELRPVDAVVVLNTIFRIEVDGLSIVHLGDNGPLTEENYRQLRPVDILMVPADAFEHILKNDEIAAIVAAIEPRVVVPMHYLIPELETEADSPGDLGEIEPWLAGRAKVVRLGSHLWEPVAKVDLAGDGPAVVVFEASAIKRREG